MKIECKSFHTLVNITGATVFVSNVSVKSVDFVNDNRVDFGEMPALFIKTFKPSSLTISPI